MRPIIYIMGVSGSGKTTIGQLLSKETRFPFFDADDFHPKENVEKMKSGIPLEDADRLPWLNRLNQLSKERATTTGAIIACSALKGKYRRQLGQGLPTAPNWIFLKGDFETILARMNQRAGHYMPPSLLKSQFETLEVPKNAFIVNILENPTRIVAKIRNWLKNS